MVALVEGGIITPDPELEDFAREKMLYPARAHDGVEGEGQATSPEAESEATSIALEPKA